jgi:chemotaxis signal transduction protein
MNPSPISVEMEEERSEERRQQRFILAKLDRYTYVFPSVAVLEILLLDRGNILQLPHYNPALLGVVEHKSQIVPLVMLRQLLQMPAVFTGETLTVVRLNHKLENLGGVGLVVDKTLGSCLMSDLPQDLLQQEAEVSSSNSESLFKLFQPELIYPLLWQPTTWL